MGPRLKTFSLDDVTMTIVKTKPNQSQWIRTLILEEDDQPRADLRATCARHWDSLKIAAAIINTQMTNPFNLSIDALIGSLGMDQETYEFWKSEADRGHGVDFIIGQLRRCAIAEKVGGGSLAWQRPQ